MRLVRPSLLLVATAWSVVSCSDESGALPDAMGFAADAGRTDSAESADSAADASTSFDGDLRDAAADPPDAESPDTALPDAVGRPTTLSESFPCDEGIETHPSVVFSEDFEEGSVSRLTARYDDFKNAAGMELVSDVPNPACGGSAIKLTAGGAESATDFFKRLDGYESLYVRYYAKYQPGIQWHHTGVWFGGYNPPLPYPSPQAGLRPRGDDRFSISIEPVFGIGGPSPRFDAYNYWMRMHSWMEQPSGDTAYYGNALIHQNAFTVDEGSWSCLEIHVQLNSDLASGRGAIFEVFKNDTLVARYDDARPRGYWVRDKFCPEGADGDECTDYPPAEGEPLVPLDLQLRSTDALELNAFWPQNYITEGPEGSVWYDAMVLATERIGCMEL